jgi:hypothetical protein
MLDAANLCRVWDHWKTEGKIRGRKTYPQNPQTEQRKKKQKRKRYDYCFLSQELKSHPRSTVILSGSVSLIPYSAARSSELAGSITARSLT